MPGDADQKAPKGRPPDADSLGGPALEGGARVKGGSPRPAPARTAERVLPEPRRWSRFLVEAWVFPLRGAVLRRLLPWAALHLTACALLGLLLNSLADAMRGFPILPYLGFFLVLLGVGGLDLLMFSTLAWWEFHVVHASAWDPEQPLDLPRFDSFDESIAHPARLSLAALLGAAPPILVAWGLRLTLLRHWQWNGWLVPAGGLFSMLLLPGTILSVAVSDTARAANPFNALRAFFAIPGRYLVACALGLPAALLGLAVVASVVSWRGAGWVIIPLAELAWLYVLTAKARILGALFWCHGERMGWLRELERQAPVPARRLASRAPVEADAPGNESTE